MSPAVLNFSFARSTSCDHASVSIFHGDQSQMLQHELIVILSLRFFLEENCSNSTSSLPGKGFTFFYTGLSGKDRPDITVMADWV